MKLTGYTGMGMSFEQGHDWASRLPRGGAPAWVQKREDKAPLSLMVEGM